MIKRKGDKLFVKWKGYDSSVNSWIDKKDLVQYYCKCLKTQFHLMCLKTRFHLTCLKHDFTKMSQYFPKPYEPLGGDINVKVDLSTFNKIFHMLILQLLH